MSSTSCASSPLGLYLAKNGGHFHPSLEYRTDSFGTSIFSSSTLTAHTSAVSCPFDLAITPALARSVLSSRFQNIESLNDHELMCSYLSFHLMYPRLASSSSKLSGLSLVHYEYVESLPKIEEMRTPSYFRKEEMDLLKGTNLLGAAQDRTIGWRNEWQGVQDELNDDKEKVLLSWEYYLYSCTMISSRAFPSSLISTSTLPSESTPILFPGVDTLNHKLGQQVTWNSDVHVETCQGKGKGRLEILLDGGAEEGKQVFNTYGPKSNAELLLGYGFTTANNPADCVILKLGSMPSNNPVNVSINLLIQRMGLKNIRFSVGRNGVTPEELKARLRCMCAEQEEIELLFEKLQELEKKEGAKEEAIEGGEPWRKLVDFIGWGNECYSTENLSQMIQALLSNLENNHVSSDESGGKIREDVRSMILEYRNGQLEIMNTMLSNLEDEMDDIEQRGIAAGSSFFDGGDEMDEEDSEMDVA